MGSLDHLGCHFDRWIETKRVIDHRYVVIDCLRNACETDYDLTLYGALGKGIYASMSAITANTIDLVDALLDQSVKQNISWDVTSAWSENCTAFLMDTAHFFWGQLNPVFINVRIDPFVPPFDPVDLLNLVAEVQRHYKLAYDYIQTRAKTTACYDYSLNFIRVEKDIFTWTCS